MKLSGMSVFTNRTADSSVCSWMGGYR